MKQQCLQHLSVSYEEGASTVCLLCKEENVCMQKCLQVSVACPVLVVCFLVAWVLSRAVAWGSVCVYCKFVSLKPFSNKMQYRRHLLQEFCCIVVFISVTLCINTFVQTCIWDSLLAGCIKSLQDAFDTKKGWSRQPLLTVTLQQCLMPFGLAVPFLRGWAVFFILSRLSRVAVGAALLHLQDEHSAQVSCFGRGSSEALVAGNKGKKVHWLGWWFSGWGLSSGPAWTGEFPLHTVP